MPNDPSIVDELCAILGVDPHSVNLSRYEAVSAIVSAINNPWYDLYQKECARASKAVGRANEAEDKLRALEEAIANAMPSKNNEEG